MKYFKFSNDFENKTGVVVFSSQILKRKNDPDVIRIGFSLIPPNTILTRQVVKYAKKKSKSMMQSKNVFLSLGYASSGKLSDTIRMIWESAIKTTPNLLPDFAIKLDLALKAHELY